MLEEKRALRRILKKEVAELTEEYCQKADEEIFKYVTDLAEYQQAETVFCYVGTAGEINTRPILEDILNSGKRLGVPKCISKEVMEVYQIESLDELEPGAYGIPEPKDGCRLIPREEIDLAIVPCISCNKTGMRLGYGAGYYDRYLESTAFTKAVLCRKKLMRENIPTEEHDLIIDKVISEDGYEKA